MTSYFDGEDWINTTEQSALVYHEELKNPDELIGINIPLFTRAYTPKSGDVVFDVGAGVGTEIHAFSKMVGETGKVFAVEADPACFRRLEKLVKLLELRNVTCLMVAVSNYNHVAWITQDREDGLGNFISSSYVDNSIQVRVQNFAELLEENKVNRIDYLKMNIEGAEISALDGLGSKLSLVRNICISCHDFLPDPQMHTFNQISDKLLKSEFTTFKHPNNEIEVWESWYLYATRSVFPESNSLRTLLVQRDEALVQRDEALVQRDEALVQRNEALVQRDEALVQRDEIVLSNIWKFTAFYRRLRK